MEGNIYMRGYGRDDNWGGGRNSSYGRYNIYMRGYGRDDLQGRGKEQKLWKVISIYMKRVWTG